MKKLLFITLAMLCAAAPLARAEEKAQMPWHYVNAQDLRIINKGFDNTERQYSRLPIELKDSARPDLWDRQQCSSGIGIRFATDSRRIGVKYDLFWNTHMIHMADTGLKGTDLYTFEGDSAWRHVNTNRPYLKNKDDKDSRLVESTYVENLDGKMHEYMVYLPLYDGVDDVYIKVDSGSVIVPGRIDLISPERKIVAYGTSILQGGCASRTGMVSTSIIGRRLNAEVVNLGFSGEGKMDSYMARAISEIPDVDLYLLDPVPNCTEMMCDTITYGFVKTIAEAHPDKPIIFLAGPIYPYARYNSFFGGYLPKKNEAAKKNILRLQQEGFNNVHWVDSDGLDGPEDDGTVDGIHLTDLGFLHYADKMTPIIQSLLGW